jgi:hypothetical protein
MIIIGHLSKKYFQKKKNLFFSILDLPEGRLKQLILVHIITLVLRIIVVKYQIMLLIQLKHMVLQQLVQRKSLVNVYLFLY